MIKTIGLAVTIAVCTGAASAQTPKQAKQPERVNIYCIEIESGTGSRIAKRECKSKAQWQREGVDVNNLPKS